MEGRTSDLQATVRLTVIPAGRARFRNPLTSLSTRRSSDFPITVAFIEHARYGTVLVDTGLGDAYFRAIRAFPARLFSWFLEARPEPGGSVAIQLQRLGRRPDRVLLTHLHPDHIGGLRDLMEVFPQTEVLLSGEAFRAAERLSGPAIWSRVFALCRGLLPELFPLDELKACQRLRLTDDLQWAALGEEWSPFDQAADLFGDGSVRLIRLPGHAAGQLGVLLRTAQGFTLLGADAAWSFRAVREQRASLGVARLIVHDRGSESLLLRGLAELSQRRPEVQMLFAHGRETRALVPRISGSRLKGTPEQR